MNPIKKFFATRLLNYSQRRIDNLYKFEGESDRVIEKQVALNKKRNKLNISDSRNKVHENFVQ